MLPDTFHINNRKVVESFSLNPLVVAGSIEQHRIPCILPLLPSSFSDIKSCMRLLERDFSHLFILSWVVPARGYNPARGRILQCKNKTYYWFSKSSGHKTTLRPRTKHCIRAMHLQYPFVVRYFVGHRGHSGHRGQ